MAYEEKLKIPRDLSAQNHLSGMQIKDISAAALAIKASQQTPSVDIIRDAARLQYDLRKVISVNKPDYNVEILKTIDIVKNAASYSTLSAANILKCAQGEAVSEQVKSLNSDFTSLYKMNSAIETILKYQKDFDNKKASPVSEGFMANARSLVEAQKSINELIKHKESEISELKCHTLIYKTQDVSFWKTLVSWFSKSKEDFYRKSLNDAFAKSFENISKALQEEKASK